MRLSMCKIDTGTNHKAMLLVHEGVHKGYPDNAVVSIFIIMA